MPDNHYNKRYDDIMKFKAEVHEEDLIENQKLVKILQNKKYQPEDLKQEMKNNYSIGDKIADKVAKFGGSWAFIIIFVVVLVLWMGTNVVGIFHFDPYPFILCNLFLSCIAAVQAPIIMMSNNRQSWYDHLHAENDFKIDEKVDAKQNLMMRRIDNIHHELDIIERLERLDLDIRIEQLNKDNSTSRG